MSTLSVQLPETLLTQIVALAAHDGLSPSEYVVETLAEKVEIVEAESLVHGERLDCTGSAGVAVSHSATIIHAPELSGATPHDHLAPYNEV